MNVVLAAAVWLVVIGVVSALIRTHRTMRITHELVEAVEARVRALDDGRPLGHYRTQR